MLKPQASCVIKIDAVHGHLNGRCLPATGRKHRPQERLRELGKCLMRQQQEKPTGNKQSADHTNGLPGPVPTPHLPLRKRRGQGLLSEFND